MRINYTPSIRIWHWLNAIAIGGLLGTFFLRKTFFSWRENSAIIVDKLSSLGVEVTAGQAKVVAKAIRAPMWEWHIIFGVMLTLLLLYRAWIVWQEVGLGYDEDESMHIHLVHWGYRILYIILIFISISGLVINWYEAIGISKDMVHSIKEIHEYAAWSIVFFVPLHIAGLFVAENIDQKGLISKMISG